MALDIKVDYNKVFAILPKIMDMPMEFARKRWYAARYIDGSFSTRPDKLVCRMVDDGIQVLEQGGESMTLFNWMVRYGGCRDRMEAHLRLVSLSAAVIEAPDFKEKQLPMRYVPREYMERSMEGRLYNPDNLTLFLRDMFGASDAEYVLRKYKVGRAWQRIYSTGEYADVTQFWYVNRKGEVLHDKKILYGQNGKRDHSFGGGRSYTKGKGYSGRCLYGSHLLANRRPEDRVYVVESEKTAMIADLFFSRHIWLATGGKANFIREGTEKDYTFISDIDAWEYWNSLNRGACPKWWEKFEDWPHGEKDDLGDYIIWKKRQNG